MTVPQWPVQIEVTISAPNVVGALDEDLRLHSWVVNQDHFPIRPGDWDVAAAAIAAEVEAINAADAGSATPDEFELRLEAAEHDDVGQDWDGLDLGVAGLVLALNAAGFATASSCRKHPGHPWADCPFVIATADVARITAIRPLIEEAHAGAADGAPGEGFGIYAGSVLPLMTLAALIVRHRATFDSLPERIGWDQDAYDAETDW